MLTFPLIHLNGTAGADLQDQVTDAMLALHAAINALQAAGPNGRDYYVQRDVTAFAQAQQQHEDRLARLGAVQAELAEISESIHAQMTETSWTRVHNGAGQSLRLTPPTA